MIINVHYILISLLLYSLITNIFNYQFTTYENILFGIVSLVYIIKIKLN